jgi:hypothetical protein
MADLTTAQQTQIFEEVGWPTSQIPVIEGIIGAESGGDPNVVAWGSGASVLVDSQGWPPPPGSEGYDEAAVGLTQELLSPASAVTQGNIEQLQNPVYNAALALQKYEQSGYRPWTGDAYVNDNPGLLGEKPVAATSNKYQQILANPSLAGAPGPSSASTSSVTLPGGVFDPLNLITGSTQSTLENDIKTLVFTGLAALAGLGLVVLGIHGATSSGQPRSTPASVQSAASLAPLAAA